MEVYEAIMKRRSISKMKDRDVPKEAIEKILKAAVWAPNHFLTHPWRFFVLTGDGRKALSNILVEIAKEEIEDVNSESGKAKLEKTASKPYRAPVVIVVAAEVDERKNVIRLEELGAVFAGIQNMLLAAEGMGLSTYWRTGTAAYHPKMKKFFGLKDKDEVLGFIYLGYSDMDKKDTVRKSPEEFTKWISCEEDLEGIIR
jgi:nitroreductase